MAKLDNIRIARPCRADWSKMRGDGRVRTCDDCNKQVYDLSELTRAEVEALIAEKHGDFCGRFYQRKDGTVLLADCTVGGSGVRARSLVAAGALVAATALARFRHPTPPVQAAAIAVPDPVETTTGEVQSTERDLPPREPPHVYAPRHMSPHPVMGKISHASPPETTLMMGDIDVGDPRP